MKYRDLLKKFQTFNDEQLDADVSIYLEDDSEFLSLAGVEITPVDEEDEHGVLDEGHPFLTCSKQDKKLRYFF